MKTKLFLSILALTATLSVSAQQLESDDMYFTSKDRAKQKASYTASLSTNNEIIAKGIKSSDQYSGRIINPEYTSRLNANSNAIQGSSNPYFDTSYKSKTTTSSNGYYNNSSNPYYGNSFYNNPYNSMYSPYSSNLYGYSGMYGYNPYSSFYSPFYSPYGYSGLSMGMGFGSAFYSPYSYNSMMMGYNMGFGSPYYGMGLGFGSYYGGYPYYGYPTTVIYNNGDSRSNIVYGKRSSRDNAMSNSVMQNSRGTVSSGASQNQGTQYVIPTGRSSTSQQYYQPDWRNNPDVNANINSGSRQSGSSFSRSQSLGTQNPSWNSGSISRQSQTPAWNNSRQSMQNNGFESPSRSNSMPSWGGNSGFGGGSMGGGAVHSSSGSRGRN